MKKIPVDAGLQEMTVGIPGGESLGVRDLNCLVSFGNRRVIIDPGVTPGYIRRGLRPHPLQVAVGDVKEPPCLAHVVSEE